MSPEKRDWIAVGILLVIVMVLTFSLLSMIDKHTTNSMLGLSATTSRG